MIDLEFVPYRNAMMAGTAQEVVVMLKVSAVSQPTPRESQARANLNIAIALDRSGSMAGRPLLESIRCAEMIIDRMTATDRLSIIGYDNHVETYLPSTYVQNRQAIKEIVRRITPGGMTALYDGWHAAAEQVAQHLKPRDISRVLLLSDGCANVGLTNPERIADHCAELATAGVSTSTYGLGPNFNELLMAAMARGGQGHANYGQTAEDLMDPFQEEFDLLDALVARKLRLDLVPEPGVSFEILNDYQNAQDGTIILPDLADEGYVWALIRAAIEDNVATPTGESKRILTASLSYIDNHGEQKQTEPCTLHLTPMPIDAYEAVAVEPVVQDRSVELQVARLQTKAAQHARNRDWAAVSDIVTQLEEIGSSNAWVSASINVLKGYQRMRDSKAFAKEAHYKAQRMSSRIADADEHADIWSSEDENSKSSFLRKKLEQGKRHGGS